MRRFYVDAETVKNVAVRLSASVRFRYIRRFDHADGFPQFSEIRCVWNWLFRAWEREKRIFFWRGIFVWRGGRCRGVVPFSERRAKTRRGCEASRAALPLFMLVNHCAANPKKKMLVALW